MTESSKTDGAFARVIAAIDVSSQDGRMLATAAEIAARLGVDVAGLFIEDVNLLRAAGLPVARHLALGSPAASSLNLEQVSTEMRALAALAESELRNSAARYGIRSSFRVVRGLPGAEIALETRTGDLLIVGAVRALADLPLTLNSPLHDLPRRVGCSILQIRHSAPRRRPLLVLGAESALTQRAIGAVRGLIGFADSRVEAILVGASSESARAAAEIEAALGERGRDIRLRYATGIDAAQIVRVAREGVNDMLVLVSDLPTLAIEAELDELMTIAPCDVLLVR